MKKTNRIFAVIMAIAMIISLCACSGSTAYDQITGTWNSTLDVTEMMNNELASSLGVDTIDSGDVKLEFAIELTFNSDKTYKAAYDKDAITQSFDTYIDWLCGWVTDYMLQSMIDQTGLDAETIESVFQSEYNMTIAEYVDDMMAQSIDINTLFNDSQMESSGYYKLEDNKLYLSPTAAGFDDDSYISYLVEGSTLTISEIVGDHDVFWSDINDSAALPAIFTRSI